jgi:Rha family phage regulatory protein
MKAISSKEVAEMLGKRHDNLLRDIRKYVGSLGDSAVEYFYEGSYTDNLNKSRSCFMCTLKGCELMANRMIGEKSTKFKEDYSSKFEEEQEQDPEVTEYPVEEVAKLLGVSERSIYNWIQKGKLKAESREFEVVTKISKMMISQEEIDRIRNVK